MFTRSAIFRGQIKPGMEDAFYAAVQERLLPAWQNMLHAQAVRLFRPQEAEGPLQDVFFSAGNRLSQPGPYCTSAGI